MDLEILVRILLAVPLVQFGLGIEQIHLAGPAVLEEANDSPGFGRMMRRSGGEGMRRSGGGGGRSVAARATFHCEQVRQREPTQASRGVVQEAAAVETEVSTSSIH